MKTKYPRTKELIQAIPLKNLKIAKKNLDLGWKHMAGERNRVSFTDYKDKL